jgi:hypothetical protein
MIRTLKIFAERHTATNAMYEFVRRNFTVNQPYYEFMGWKHRLAPESSEWKKYRCADVLFVFLVRSPYTWLKAMHRQPYYYHQPTLKNLAFRHFIRHSMEDYENVIQIWNKKNLSYWRMASEVPNSIILRMEDFLLHQGKIWEKLGRFLTMREEKYIPFREYMTGYGASENDSLDKVLRLPPVPDATYRLINQEIDTTLMSRFDYPLMWSSSDAVDFDEGFLRRI